MADDRTLWNTPAPTPSGASARGGGAVAIRGGAIRVAAYIVGVLVSLGAASVLVRQLGVPAFGRYVTVTSLVALVGGVTEAGIYVFGIREFNLHPDRERRPLMAQLLGMRLALTAAGLACAVLFGLIVGYRSILILGTLVAGVGLMIQVTADVLSIALQARLELAKLAAIDLGRRILALVLFVVLALTSAGILPFLAASTVAAGAALLVLTRLVASWIPIKPKFAWQAWKNLFAETLPFAIAMSIGAVYFYVTVILMSLIASSTQTGLFATSFRVIQVALGVPILLLTAVFPLLSRSPLDTTPQAGELVGKVFTVSLICGVWMSLATILGAEFIIHLIAAGKAAGAVPVLRIQALALTLTFISTSSSLGLISIRRYRPLVVASSAGLALDIALGVILIPALGARGGALADVITEGIIATGLTIALLRAVPHHQIEPPVLSSVAAATVLAAAVWFLPLGSAFHALAATVVYFSVLLRLRAIPADVLRAAGRLLPRRAVS